MSIIEFLQSVCAVMAVLCVLGVVGLVLSYKQRKNAEKLAGIRE